MSPHTLVKRIIVRHFRGNQELKPIAVENNFDFNFQDFRRFSEKLIILPGDQITVECTYDTKKLNRPIFVSPQSVFYLGILIENFYFLRKKTGWIIYSRRDVYGFYALLSSNERYPYLFERFNTGNCHETIQYL